MFFIYSISLLAGILYGITESINKNITEKKYSAFSYFFIQVSLNLLLSSIPFFLYGKLPKEPIAYIYVTFPIIFFFLGNLFMIKAYKTEDISNLNILSRASLIIAFFTGIFLLHEKITTLNIIGILTILLGILVIFYEGRKLKLSPGFLYAISAGILVGMTAYFRKLALSYFNPISIVFLIHLFLTILTLTIPRTYKDLRPIFIKYKKKIILSRFTAVAGFYLINWAIAKGKISIANTNYETAFLLSSSFIGIMLLGEKSHIIKKITGSFLCILGIILLNFF